jgi:hypothetical protein
MRLNPAAFNAFLGGNIGQNFNWRRSYRCPCFNPQSGAANPSCPQCAGAGVIWNNPVLAPAGVANQKVQREWSQFGQWQSGDVVVTIPQMSSMYAAGEFDRVTMLNAMEAFSLQLTSGSTLERIHMQVTQFTRVFWLDVNGNIVDGTAVPTVGTNGVLTWPVAGAPPSGTQYSISGTALVEYFVWGNYPQNRNEHFGAQLPKRVVLRKFDLFGRQL